MTAALDWRSRPVPVIAGLGDTRKRGGQPYRTRPLGDILAGTVPQTLPKDRALAFLPSLYFDSDARSHAAQREHGQFVALVGDIDHGDYPLDLVASTVAAVARGAAWSIYSTASAKPDDRRWRVVVPLSEPSGFDDWHDAQLALVAILQDRGLELDTSAARPGQISFLPNVPAELRGADGQPLFFEQRSNNSATGFCIRSGDMADAIAAIRAKRAADDAERERIRAEAFERRTRRPISSGDGGSMIDAFNRDNEVTVLLASYNYQQSPRNGDDWRSPLQTSESYATRVVESDKWISLSGSDAAAGLGERHASGCFGDAFDLFCHFEHGGDRKAALRQLHKEREAMDYSGSHDPETGEVLVGAKSAANDDAGKKSGAIRATPYDWRAATQIPPRRWLLGYWLLRGEITAIIAPGGIGKSTLTVGMALSLSSGSELLGARIYEGPGSVWLWNLEDDRDELARQVTACGMRHSLGPNDCGNRLYVDSGLDMALCTAIEGPNGFRIIEPVFDALKAEIQARKIDVLVVDPFVSSHQVTENDNNMIDAVAKRWKRLASETGIAIVLVHHSKKVGGRDVKAEDSRGAVALIAAARVALTLNSMTKEAGEGFGITDEKELRRFIRIDDDKSNRAPPQAAAWFRKASVPLGNADAFGRSDDVGAIEPWTPPDPFEGISARDLYNVQLRIQAGEYGENSQAGDWAGHVVAEVIGADLSDKADKVRVKSLLRQWTGNGAFKVEHRTTDKGRQKPFLVVGNMVDPTTLPTSQSGVG